MLNKKLTPFNILFFFALVNGSTVLHAQQPAPQNKVVDDAKNLAPVTGSFNPLRYSEGYALGFLSEIRSERHYFFIETLEGKVILGRLSSAGGYLDNSCLNSAKDKIKAKPDTAEYDTAVKSATTRCTTIINPWLFSSENENLVKDLASLGNQEVMLMYDSYLFVPFINSDHYLNKVYPTDPNLLPANAAYEEVLTFLSRAVRAFISRQTGFVDGRIVRASLDNVVRKAYQIVLQQGPSGDVFTRMSVDDSKLFNFIVKAMATGKPLRVYYEQLYSPLAKPENFVAGYKTNFRVYKVQVLGDQPEQAAPPTNPVH